MRRILSAFSALLCLSAFAADAFAQPAPTPAPRPLAADRAPREPDAAAKQRKNAWTVGIATGQLEAAYPRLAADLAKALDDGDNLRVLPMITYGSVGNVEDLLYLRNVEVAFTKSDSFEYFRKEKKIANIDQRIHYIARLFDAELHILVRPEIRSLEDLNGKKVNLGSAGNAANVTAPIVFEKLGIRPEPIFVDHAIGLEMMKKGEIAAAIRVAGKPSDTYAKIPPNSGFYFLPITVADYAKHFSDLYLLGKLTSQDYPTLIPPGETVSTISVPDILAAYNWPKGSERYNRVERFVDAFYSKFNKLLQPPFHPKWKDVNLAADLPGWTRFEPAARMVQKMAGAEASTMRTEFESFLQSQGSAGRTAGRALSPQDRETLFKDFMTWRSQR